MRDFWVLFMTALWFQMFHILCVRSQQPPLVLTSVLSEIDSKHYLVANYSDQIQAANYLAQIRKGFDLLSMRLKSSYPSDPRVQRLLARYSSETLIQENIQNNRTSYSINKGELIALCLRSPNQKFEKLNSIKFVSFHELTHVITDSLVEHNPEFYSNFRFLLSHAIKWRLYEEVNYRQQPTSYCGTRLTSSPSNLERERKMRSYL
jgi:hypothetical protein